MRLALTTESGLIGGIGRQLVACTGSRAGVLGGHPLPLLGARIETVIQDFSRRVCVVELAREAAPADDG